LLCHADIGLEICSHKERLSLIEPIFAFAELEKVKPVNIIELCIVEAKIKYAA
jgi:hypothetical protein